MWKKFMAAILALSLLATVFATQVFAESNSKDVATIKTLSGSDLKVVALANGMAYIELADKIGFSVSKPKFKKLIGLLQIHLEFADEVVKNKNPVEYSGDAGKFTVDYPGNSTAWFILRSDGKGTEEGVTLILGYRDWGSRDGPGAVIKLSPENIRAIIAAINEVDKYVSDFEAKLNALRQVTAKANAYF